jgi:hypothetical protein
MVALKQGPDDSLVPTGANEVLVLMGVDDVLVELDDVLLELDKALVEVDRVKVLVLKVDDGASDTEDVVEEDLLPLPLLPLPLPLPLLPLPYPSWPMGWRQHMRLRERPRTGLVEPLSSLV